MLNESTIIRTHEQSRDYYLERADRDIEKNRKGDFTLKLEGEGLDGAEASYCMKRLDFELGCNIFMLDQYEDAERQELYLNQWRRLFNTAVVPFYWEGTEPTQGQLRYAKDCGSEVYRRPPADRVVEYCKENGIGMKGHPLFWHEFIPEWLPSDWNELSPLIEKRFKEIGDRYSADIAVFDCVNEPGRIWDMTYEHRCDGYKMVAPPEGYLHQLFALGKKYFPHSELVLNEATGSALAQFKGVYGSYYLLLKQLIADGLKIDRIGIQCHCDDSPVCENIFDAARFYGILDGYARLGKPLVLSEIGLSCEDEELQAEAAEWMYKICFSHDSMAGIFWWNLDDDGIMNYKSREGAVGENLPYGGLCRQGREKRVYKTLDRLINQEWTTKGESTLCGNELSFRGFYGQYEITVKKDGIAKSFAVDFKKNGSKSVTVKW